MGGRATAEAVHVLSELGLDLSGHESQPLTEQLVRHADFIYTMTHSHRLALLSQWPEAAQRTFVLCPDESDVADPIGGPPELYRTCAEQIAAALEVRMKDIPL
jgi:protein-tyrosine-phosphatase